MKVDPGDFQGRPITWEFRCKAKAIGRWGQPHEAVKHDLRDQNGFKKLLVEPQSTSDIAALEGATRGVRVIVAITGSDQSGLSVPKPMGTVVTNFLRMGPQSSRIVGIGSRSD